VREGLATGTQPLIYAGAAAWATVLGLGRRGPRRQEPGPTDQYNRLLASPLTSCPTAAGTPAAVGYDAKCTFLENFH
jgi:hypothetical protein